MNYNKLFINSERSDLIGKNMSTVTIDQTKISTEGEKWYKPRFALFGTFCLGHQTNIENILSLNIYENEKLLNFTPKRHLWTPAYSETVYRCEPQKEYYEKNGCISVKEKKCITSDDVFVSELKLKNEKKESIKLTLDFCVPKKMFTQASENAFYTEADILAGALMKKFTLSGYFSFFGCDLREEIEIPPQKSYSIKYCFAFDRNIEKSKEKAKKEHKNDSFAQNENVLNEWFDKNVPVLNISDRELEKIYYYRFLLIYINSFSPKKVIPEHFIENEVMYENRYGGWYGCPVTLPLPLQINEAKWLNDGKLSENQIYLWKSERLFMEYIQYTPMSVWEYYLTKRDKKILSDIYPFCKKFTLQKYSEKDALPITEGSWLTGAEYQPSFYQHTNPKWDWRQDCECAEKNGFEIIKLYRLDEISYFAANLKACSKIALELGINDESEYFDSLYKRVVEILKKSFWNNKDKIFYDIDFKSKKHCNEAPCYDSFAPFLFGSVNEDEYFEAFEKLFDYNWFGDDFGAVTVSKGCKMYWFDNCLTDGFSLSLKNPHEYGCCWNGPIWPYAMSLILNAFGEAAYICKKYREKWLLLFEKYCELHFFKGNRSVPCIFEHYRPEDGVTFSNSCDYFHSNWIDLFMKYWAGIKIKEDKIEFSPFTQEEFELKNIFINGKYYRFIQFYKSGELKTKIEITEEKK